MIIDLTAIGKVKQCPFCGNYERIKLVIDEYPYCRKYSILCGTCGARSQDANEPEKAIGSWNRRAKE